MARIRRKLFHTYANLDLPIQWQDPVVEAWASGKNISTRRDCMAVTSTDQSLRGNKSLKVFPEFKWFTGVKKLYGSMFNSCDSLTHIELPDSLTSIGDNAFYDCKSLTSISLPDSLTSIGSYYVFRGCTKLENIDLSHVTSLTGWWAFQICTSLKSVYLPECLDVDHQAFESCTSLKTVIMPKVKNIGYRPFGNCTSLERLDLPASVTNIWNDAFLGCTALKVITIAATTPPALDTTALRGQSAEFYVPDDAVETYKAASGWSAYASRIHPMSECPSE